MGNNTRPALAIRKAATWNALSVFSPSFINIKELPQIKHNATNNAQFISIPRRDDIQKFAQISIFNFK